jgi:hypothetical protein
MSVLWTLDTMAAAMHAERAGPLPMDLAGISIDSRKLTRGEAFFAIQGENRDGHDFVDDALKAGAGLAVVSRGQRGRFANAPLLVVPDVLEAWREPRVRACMRKSSPSPALSARPAQRKHCDWRCRPTAKHMLLLRRTTITGVCRYRSRAVR